jgi:hypothetical protein
MHHSLKIKGSKIHGQGIFTEKNINERELFYLIPINNISQEPKSKLAKIYDIGWVNDPEILNWINHSCNPNSELIIKNKQPYLCAIKNIQPDTEITVDYNLTEYGGEYIECNCNDSNCKKTFPVIKTI